MKTCTRCKIEKPVGEFGRLSNSPDGLRSQCKICHRLTNKESKVRNLDKVRERDKKYQKKERIKLNAQSRRRKKILREMNPEAVFIKNKEAKKRYREKDPIRYRALENKRQKRKRKNDIAFKLRGVIRTRIGHALNGNEKKASATKSVGIPMKELKVYLESMFYVHPITGISMSWDNYGRGNGKWQIDHIRALCLFDLADISQFLIACHYTNLQPLWYEDHVNKTSADIRILKNAI